MLVSVAASVLIATSEHTDNSSVSLNSSETTQAPSEFLNCGPLSNTLLQMYYIGLQFVGDIENYDTSQVTDMNGLFLETKHLMRTFRVEMYRRLPILEICLKVQQLLIKTYQIGI